MDENFTKNKTNKTGLVKVNKNKDDKIVVRIDAKLKEQFIEYVESKGATVSDYVRQMIMKELSSKQMKPIKTYIKSVKNIKTEFIDQEADISKEIQIIKENMIKLENRINKRLNENKE